MIIDVRRLIKSEMVQILSKLEAFDISCTAIHGWNESCLQFITGMFLGSVVQSFKAYTYVYALTLLTKGRIPTKTDLKRTLYGIFQSTAFLSGTAFGYSLFLCSLRRLLGNFNILTVSALPAFLSSVFSILIERPSRRTLLCLYVSNVATETVWNMLESRSLVRSIKYGDVAIFSASMALMLLYYKGGHHKKPDEENAQNTDSMFGVLRFVVGPYEEKDYTRRSTQVSSFYRQQVRHVPNDPSSSATPWNRNRSKTFRYRVIWQAFQAYKKIIQRIKCCDRHYTCPHPFSCLYYTMEGAGKMFSLGLGIQITLKLVLNIKRIISSPKAIKSLLFKKETLNLAVFFGGFTGLFRAVLCILRRSTGKDNPYYAVPAGLIAGCSFIKYPDTTVSLYVMWKAAQITYNLGIDRGYLPKVPGFTEFLYCFSTAILFHAALLEPTNLRPSYWKFLHSISGGRVACMNRIPLDVWGLNTSESLNQVLKATKTVAVIQL